MNTVMSDTQIRTIEEVREFLAGTGNVRFAIETKAERYEWLEATLVRFRYENLGKLEKGLMLDFLEKVSGYSRIQVKRLVGRYVRSGRVRLRNPKNRGFVRKYSVADIELLAKTDELHGTLSGPATKKICERACDVFGDKAYLRLAEISVAHLYNLRNSRTYRKIRIYFRKTNARQIPIGERRRPRPEGCPGYLRVDTVHQGDLDGIKGVYHINAVDEITQFEIVCSLEKISEIYLIPVLDELIGQFPFLIRGFHSDNGSEYINRQVAALLNKLLIELTKSRARRSNDNALVESKNGSIVRKHLGYTHIPQKYAPLINDFLRDFLNPYVNFHRPCFFPQIITDHRGKQKKLYKYQDMMTPYEKLKSLPNAKNFLKKEINFEILDQKAYKLTDNQMAKLLTEAKFKLFNSIDEQERKSKKFHV